MNDQFELYERTAHEIVNMVLAHCERVAVAGSLRRGATYPQDIELVILPKPGLLKHLDELVDMGYLSKRLVNTATQYGALPRPRWGDKTRFAAHTTTGIAIDIFMSDSCNWGPTLFIRTGPGSANKFLMTSLIEAKSKIRFRDGYLWYGTAWKKHKSGTWSSPDEQMLCVREELDVFKLLNMNEIEPRLRSDAAYHLYVKRPDWMRHVDVSDYVIKVEKHEQIKLL